jgi:hypothetical protein
MFCRIFQYHPSFFPDNISQSALAALLEASPQFLTLELLIAVFAFCDRCDAGVQHQAQHTQPFGLFRSPFTLWFRSFVGREASVASAGGGLASSIFKIIQSRRSSFVSNPSSLHGKILQKVLSIIVLAF